MTTTNRSSTQGKDQQVIVGIKQDLQSMSSIPLGATTYTPTSLVALVQSRIDAGNAVVTAKANWQGAVKTYDAINTQVTLIERELRNLVIATFGPTSPKLADFGFAPPKKAELTADEKAAAVAKRAATRKARGTMGKKQKLEIKGTVATPATGATPAVITASSAPAPASSTAPVAPVPAVAPASQASAVTANGAPASAAPAVAPVKSS
jgi:hypothetical protein